MNQKQAQVTKAQIHVVDHYFVRVCMHITAELSPLNMFYQQTFNLEYKQLKWF